MFYICCYVALIIMCEKGKCALSLIYPNSDSSTYACDTKCYFEKREGKKHKEWYIKHYPKQMKDCKCGDTNAT